MSVFGLPQDVLVEMQRYLSPIDRMRVAMVCKDIFDIYSHHVPSTKQFWDKIHDMISNSKTLAQLHCATVQALRLVEALPDLKTMQALTGYIDGHLPWGVGNLYTMSGNVMQLQWKLNDCPAFVRVGLYPRLDIDDNTICQVSWIVSIGQNIDDTIHCFFLQKHQDKPVLYHLPMGTWSNMHKEGEYLHVWAAYATAVMQWLHAEIDRKQLRLGTSACEKTKQLVMRFKSMTFMTEEGTR